MSRLQNKLDLNVMSDGEAQQIRESHVQKGIGNLKSKVAGMDIQVESKVEAPTQREVKPFFNGTELAEAAIASYKTNIKPDEGGMEQPVDEGPDTKAKRVNARAIQRALVGLRNGGNEGKLSLVGPNGTGNVGKYSPSASGGSGNATNNTDNYYSLTTDMTLEQYSEYIDKKFSPEVSKEEVAESKEEAPQGPNVLEGLKKKLLQLEDSAWQSIDIVMREVAKENGITPKNSTKHSRQSTG